MDKYTIDPKIIEKVSKQNQEKVKKFFKRECFIPKYEDKGKNEDKTIDFIFCKNYFFCR